MIRLRLLCWFILLLPLAHYTQSNPQKEEQMYSYFEKGYNQIYVQKDSAYHDLEKALNIAVEINDYESSLGILDHIVITADYHYDLPKYRNALRQIDRLLSEEDIGLRIQNVENWQIGYLMWLASYHFETMEYVKAKELFVKARGHFDEIPTEHLTTVQADRLFTLYSSLGTTYMNLGSYELAEINYLRSIELIKTSETLKENAEAYITGANQSLAQLYTRMGKHEKAYVFYLKNLNWSKENYQKDRMFKNNLVNAFQKITASYIAQDSLEQALRILNESRPFLLENDPFLNDALVLYGDIYTGLKNYDEGLKSYQKALAVLRAGDANRINQGIAEVQGKIAVLYLKQNDYRAGLNTVQNAFNAAGNNIRISNNLENPDPTEVFSKIQLLHLLDIKLKLLKLGYEETSKTEYQNNALEANKAILETFDLLKKEFDSKLDKQFLAETAYPIFHRMLNVTFEAYKKNNSPELFELALNISEKNKDFLLLEALRNSNATQYGNVPSEIIEKEARLRAEISNQEKNLFGATEGTSDFSEDLFKLKQEYYGFLDTLKLKYPKYHDLKYQSQALNLITIGNSLHDDEVLISYTMGEEHLFALVLDASTQDFVKLPFDKSDQEAVRNFYRLLSSPTITDNSATIFESGKPLFEKILQPLILNFKSHNLTIIPDGVLHYLPFDMLVNDDDLLIQSKNIGYANSINSYFELREKEEVDSEKLLAFAPSFDDEIVESEIRFEFGKLLYNDDEVEKIGSVFDTEIYSEGRATLENFKSLAPDFNIIHLATHASANDEYPDYSYLAFSKNSDSTASNILYIKDLYNTVLNAEMVTLSACQTGIGKLQKGQGMMSLSKGFFYAGAKSLVNTLWKINDKSSVKLMEFFYEGLSKGKNKKEALRDAKLKYLSTTEDDLLKHPYYWSAFVVSGDTAPLSTAMNFWWIFGLGFVVLLFIWLYLRKSKSLKN